MQGFHPWTWLNIWQLGKGLTRFGGLYVHMNTALSIYKNVEMSLISIYCDTTKVILKHENCRFREGLDLKHCIL